jgi:hypothetical protein
MVDKLIGLFQWVATTQGFGWALLLAVSVAYWLEVQDRKKNTVDKALYLAEKERSNAILDNQVSMSGAQAQLTELVKIALFQKGGTNGS